MKKTIKRRFNSTFSFCIEGTAPKIIVPTPPPIPLPPRPPGLPVDKPIPPDPIQNPLPIIDTIKPVRVVWGWSWISYYIDFPDYPGDGPSGDSSSWVTGFNPETGHGTISGTANSWSKNGDGSTICDVTLSNGSYNIDETSPCWSSRPPGGSPQGSYWPSWNGVGIWGDFLDFFENPVLTEVGEDGGETGWFSYQVSVANVLHVYEFD